MRLTLKDMMMEEGKAVMNDIPIRKSVGGTYRLTAEDKDYIKSLPVDGVIPFQDYITALKVVLNRQKGGSEDGYSH